MRMQTNSLNGKEIYVSAIGKSIIFFFAQKKISLRMPLTSRKSTCAHKHMCIYLSDIFGQIIIYDFWPTTTTTIPSTQMVAARALYSRNQRKLRWTTCTFCTSSSKKEKKKMAMYTLMYFTICSIQIDLLLTSCMRPIHYFFPQQWLECFQQNCWCVYLSACLSVRPYVRT